MCRALLLLVAGALALSPACAGPSTVRTGSSAAAAALSDLQAVPLVEDWPVDVPPEARAHLRRLKTELRTAIEGLLARQVDAGTSAAEIQQALRRRFDGLLVEPGAACSEAHDWSSWCLLDLEVSRPKGHEDLIAVMVTLGIPCGSDSSLYLYRSGQEGWSPVLVREAPEYERIDAAWGDFVYAISPPDVEGRWFAVIQSFANWCASMHHPVRFEILRPGESPERPKVLLDREVGAIVGEHAVRAGVSEALVVYQVMYTLETLWRERRERYSVRGDEVIRLPPLEEMPGDFVDDWVGLPWEQASGWVAAEARPAARAWHSRLAESRHYRLRFAQPCDLEGRRWLVGVCSFPPGRCEDGCYLSVAASDEGHTITAIGSERPPGCPGEATPEGWE